MTSKPHVTLADVAERAGVSVMTVSLALREGEVGRMSNETRRRVRETAKKLGYRPYVAAQRLVRRQTNLIGVMADLVGRPWLAHKVDLAIRELLGRGYEPLLWSNEWSSSGYERACDIFLSNQVTGVVVAEYAGDLAHVLKPLMDAQLPVVSLDAGGRFPGVGIDRRQAFYDLTTHLLALGHERLGFVWPEDPQTAEASSRAKGMQAAIRDSDREITLSFIEAPRVPEQGADLAVGARAAARFLADEDRPTAVACFVDHAALGFISQLHRAGIRVPQDVAVVGFGDDTEASYSYPALTTVTRPFAEVCEQAMDVLLGLINEPQREPPEYREIPGQLIIRESCGYRAAHEAQPDTRVQAEPALVHP